MRNTLHRSGSRLAVVLVATMICLALPTLAEDWPQYRGPLQEGRSPELEVFGTDPFGLAQVWKRKLGRGYSSVLVAHGLVVTMYGDDTASWTVALDPETGEERWRYRVGDYYPAHTGSQGGPSSTPVIDAGVLYGVGRFGNLFALNLADGHEQWSVELEGQSFARTPHYGWTTSPVIVGDLVTLLTGGESGNTITAFDRKTGKQRWATGDGAVSYQTPAVLELAGRVQLVAVNDSWILGLDPVSGETLWKYEHGTFTVEAFAQPLPIGKDRFLINSLREVVAYELERSGKGYTIKELWRSTALKSSYAIPVYHDGSVFGFSRTFLLCLDASTGEVRWKSREPGGRGLILVDGHLVILDPDGAVVVAVAQAEGYEERARLATFDRYSHAPPSFANGRIYVRNESEIAALGVVHSPAVTAVADPSSRQLLGEFGALVARAEATDDPAAVVQPFLDGHPTFPVVEGDIAHFIYQGEADAMGLSGTFLEWWDPVEMSRIGDTDVWFYSVRLDPTAVWEYRFHPDFERRISDPRNPHAIGSASELRMPQWHSPDHIAEPTGDRGRIDSFEFRSDVLDVTRRIRLYLPAGYGRGSEHYPVVFAHHGNRALDTGNIDRTLDNIIGSRVQPVIVVFLPAPTVLEEMAGARTPDLTRMVVEELIPHIDRNYRTIPDRTARALVGPGNGGILSLYAALRAPEVFGMAAAQSSDLQVRVADELLQMIAAGGSPRPTIYLQWTGNDSKFGEGGIDAEAGSRTLYEAFQAAGYDVYGREVPGSSGWSTWRAYFDDILEAFFPLETANRTAGP